MRTPAARRLGLLSSAAAMGAGFVVWGLIPAVAHDGRGNTGGDHHSSPQPIDSGSQLPELPLAPGKPEAPGPPITSLQDLQKYEQALDPEGTSGTYICANVGDTSYTVVMSRSAPADLKPDPLAGPITRLPDPCAGKTLVAGKSGK